MDYKSMSNEELEERYADIFMTVEVLRKVFLASTPGAESVSKKTLGKRLVEFQAIQLEVQMRLINGAAEPASPWRTGVSLAEAEIMIERYRKATNGMYPFPAYGDDSAKRRELEIEYSKSKKELQSALMRNDIEPASPWRTGEPEVEGKYLCDFGRGYYGVNNFKYGEWNYNKKEIDTRWMPIPGVEYGERAE